MYPDFSYINDDGRKVGGTAAVLRKIFTEMGGLQNYNDMVGEQYIKTFISDQANAVLDASHKRKQIKRTG